MYAVSNIAIVTTGLSAAVVKTGPRTPAQIVAQYLFAVIVTGDDLFINKNPCNLSTT